MPELSKEAWSPTRFEALYPSLDNSKDTMDKVFDVLGGTDATPTFDGNNKIVFSSNGTPGTEDRRQAIYTKDQFNVLTDSFRIAFNIDLTATRAFDPNLDLLLRKNKYGTEYSRGLAEGVAFAFFKTPTGNLTVDDLGVGSTLNEVYEKLGTPWIGGLSELTYRYEIDGVLFYIVFKSDDKIFDPRTNNFNDVKNNVITNIGMNKLRYK